MARLAVASVFPTLLHILTIFSIFSTCVFAGPMSSRSSHSCVTHCKESKHIFYDPGNTYVYDYTADIRALVLEEDTPGSQVTLFSKVEIEPLSSCEYKLRFNSVKLTESENELPKTKTLDNDLHFRRELEKHTTRFGFHDGKIEHFCSDVEEPVWVSNIKRGVLSMLQNTMDDYASTVSIQETDVNGRCKTQYTPQGSSWGGAITVKKTKDLTKCTNRESHLTVIQSIPYSSDYEKQGMSLLTGTVECTQVVRSNIIEMVQCREEQVFKPFESKNSGAKSIITQDLAFASTHSSKTLNQEEFTFVKKGLLYEVDGLSDETGSDIIFIKNLLQKIEAATSPSVLAETPGLFIELVEVLRQLNVEALRSLLSDSEKESWRHVLLDALPLVNSAGSLAVMTDFYIQGTLTLEQAQSWLGSLIFIKYPSSSMISALLPLVHKDAKSSVLFSISSLINSYCKNTQDCQQEPLIRNATSKLSENLKDRCKIPSDEPEVRKAVVALKAIGNTGIYPVPNLSSKMPNTPLLEVCFLEITNPIEVRLSALDAHRRMPCSDFSSDAILHVYADKEENVEVRIKAYLTVMNCANRHVIEAVKTVLQSEQVNQVGSFVWTHLTNIQESNRPDKKLIRTLVTNELLKNKFKTDARKFSRNYESSSFWEDYNVGAGLDGNIVFTEESFLPKSGMANLTIQLFGESINLLEFGGRMLAGENLLDPIFGPNGYFPDDNIAEFLENTRTKREVGANEVERLDSVLKQSSPRFDKATSGSFYARIFGHEVMYKNFEVNSETAIPSVVDETGKNLFSIRSILNNLSTGKKLQYTKSSVLMDISYSVPSTAGIPLSLVLKAASTLTLLAEGKFNVGKFIETRQLDIHGLLHPNTAVNVDASLTVRLGARNRNLQSGLAVRNILRSSTAVETLVMIDGYKKVKASLSLLQPRQDIFEVSSTLIARSISGKETEVNQIQGAPIIEYYKCFGEDYSDILGIKLCGEYSVPQYVSFPPTSPVLVKLYFEKTEAFQGYEFDYTYQSNPTLTSVQLVLDTPGSTTARKVVIKYRQEAATREVSTSLETPTKSITAKGKYSKFEKSLNIIVDDDGERLLNLNSSLTLLGNKVEPRFTLVFLKRKLADLSGVIELPQNNADQREAKVELVLKHVTQTPIRLNGNFRAFGDTHQATLGIESYYLTGNIKSLMKEKPGHWSTKSVMEYSWKHGEVNSIDMSAKFQKTRKGNLAKLNAAVGFMMSNFPELKTDISWETLTSSSFCENTAKVTIGKSTWDGHTLFSRQSSRDHNELRLQVAFLNERQNIDYLLEFAHQMNEQGIATKLIGRTSPQNEFRANFDYNSEVRPFLKKSLKAETGWYGSEYSLRATIYEKKKGEFEGELLVDLNKLKEMKGTVTYINKSSNLKLDHELEFRARGFTPVPLSGSLSFSATDKQSHVGCQIQLEGRKPYSSRLGTSIDYSNTNNAHKIEAKVTVNEKKYNGEITFGRTKSGIKHLSADLHFNSHIRFDAKLTGMFPEPMTLTANLIPDKDNLPDENLELRSSLDFQTIVIKVDYFGEIHSFEGGYKEDAFAVEGIWSGNQRLVIDAKFPWLETHRSSLSVFILAPIDGFHNVSAFWEHHLQTEAFELKVGGSLADKSALIQVSTVTEALRVEAKGNVQISGVSPILGTLSFIFGELEKELHLSFQKDDQESVLLLTQTRTSTDSTLNFDFRGCTFLPEIALRWNRESMPGKETTKCHAQWAVVGSILKHLDFQLDQNFNPATYNFSISTPWNFWKEAQGHLVSQEKTLLFDLISQSTSTFVPSKLELNISAVLENFYSHLKVVTNSQESSVLVKGRVNGLADVDLVGVLEIPNHQYETILISKTKDNRHNASITTNWDGKENSVGFSKHSQSSVKYELEAWGRFQTEETSKSANAVYTNDKGLKTFILHSTVGDEALMKLEGSLISSSVRLWNISSSLETSYLWIPSFYAKSYWNMVDHSQIIGRNSLSFTRTSGSFLDAMDFFDAKNFDIQFDVKDFNQVTGSVSLGNRTLQLNGEIKDRNQGHAISVELSSTEFNLTLLNAEYSLLSKAFSFKSDFQWNAQPIFDTSADIKWPLNAVQAKGFLTSQMLPIVEAEIDISLNEGWSLTVDLRKDHQSFILFKGNGQATPNAGQAKVSLSSIAYFSWLQNMTMETMYQLDSNGIKLSAEYGTTTAHYLVKGEGIWEENEQRLLISSSGDYVASIEATIENFRTVRATMTLNRVELAQIKANYVNEMKGFGWGTHTINMEYINKDKISNTIWTEIGLDPKRYNFEMKTPFTLWTHIQSYGQFDLLSPSSKVVKFRFSKEEDVLDSSFEMKSFKRNGTSTISTEISVTGFSNLRDFIVENTPFANFSQYLSQKHSEKFSADVRWSSSHIDVELNTPLKHWKALLLSAKLERNRLIVNLGTNDYSYVISGSAKFDKLKGNFDLSLTDSKKSNFKYQTVGTYDLTKNYDAAWSTSGPRFDWKFRWNLISKVDSVLIEISTPFKGYETLSGKVAYTLSKSNRYEGELLIEWTVNAIVRELYFSGVGSSSNYTVTVRTPIHPWDTLSATLKYDASGKNFQFEASRGDGKQISITFDSETTGNVTVMSEPATAKIELQIQTPFEGFEKGLFSMKYDRALADQNVLIIYKTDDRNLYGEGKFLYRNKGPLSLELDAKLLGDHLDYKAHAALAVNFEGKSYLAAYVESQNTKHEIDTVVESSPNVKTFNLKTTLPFLSQLDLKLQNLGGITIEGSWQGNGKKAEFYNKMVFEQYKNAGFNLSITSPISGFKSILMDFNLEATPDGVLSTLRFQNEEHRWLGRVEGGCKDSNGEWQIDVKTPIEDFQDVFLSLKHTLTLEMKTVKFGVRRNSNWLVELDTTIKPRGIQLKAASVPYFPLNVQLTSQWSNQPLILQLAIHGGDEELKTSLELSIQGIQSGMFNVKSSWFPAMNTQLSWNSDGNYETGNAWASLTNSLVETKALRALWRRDGWKQVVVEFWMRSNEDQIETGGTASYIFAPNVLDKTKISTIFTYISSEGTSSVSGFVTARDDLSNFDFALNLETPVDFVPIHKVKVQGALTLGPELQTQLLVNAGESSVIKIDAVVDYRPRNSSLKFNLALPSLIESFQIDASYDFLSDDRSIYLFFSQDETIFSTKIKLDFPSTMKEGEIGVQVFSNIPFQRLPIEGSLMGTYRSSSDGITEVNIFVESDQTGEWKLSAALRPTQDFLLKFQLDAPEGQPIPSTLLAFSWRGSIRQGISSELELELSSLKASATLTITQDKLNLLFKSNVPSLEVISLIGQLTLQPSKQLEVSVNLNEKEFKIISQCDFRKGQSTGYGSIVLVSPTANKTIGSLRLVTEENGKVQFTGVWDTHEVTIKGQMVGTNGRSWGVAGLTQLSFDIDGSEQFEILSIHEIRDGEYSWNVTAGREKHLKIHFIKGESSKLDSTVQWNSTDSVTFRAETKRDRFNVYLSSPWVPEVEVYGMLKNTITQSKIDGYLIYDQIKSTLAIRTSRRDGVSNFEIFLEIPALNQNLNARIALEGESIHQSEARLNMTMNGLHACVTGKINSEIISDNSSGNRSETKLVFSLKLPSEVIPEVEVDVTILKPTHHFGSMQIDSIVSVSKSKETKLSFSYDTGIYDSNAMFFNAKLESPVLAANNYELSLSSPGPSFKQFTGHLLYNTHEFDINWAVNLPKLNARLSFAIPDYYQGLSKYSVGMDAYIDVKENLNISVDAVCKEKALKMHAFAKREESRIISGVSILCPELIGDPQEFSFEGRRVNDVYFIDFSGQRGPNEWKIVSEIRLKELSTFSATGKMTGQYGYHHANFDYNRNGVVHEVILNLESSSLLSYKMVGITGTLTPTSDGLTANLQCQSIRSTHSISLEVRPASKNGMISFTVQSTSFSPLHLDIDWQSSGSKFCGTINATLLDTSNQMEALLDISNFEGKLVITSPIIPSSKFLFHLKSVLSSENIHVIGDIQIRDTHWRLESAMKYSSLIDMGLKLEIISPYEFLDRLTLALVSSTDEFYAEIYTPVSVIPNAFIKMKGLSRIRGSGGSWKDLQPSVSLGLPDGSYTAVGTLISPNASTAGLLHILLKKNNANDHEAYELQGKISPLGYVNLNMNETAEIFVRIRTPMTSLELFEVQVKGRMKGRNVLSLSSKGTLNEESLSFDFFYQNANDRIKVETQLITPFEDYKNLTLQMGVESLSKIGNGKSLHIELNGLSSEETILLNTDYRYRYTGMLDMDGEFNAVFGTFMAIPPVHIEVTSGMKETRYTGVALCSSGSQSSTLKFEVEMLEDKFQAVVNGKAGTEDPYRFNANVHLLRDGQEFNFQNEVTLQDDRLFLLVADYAPSQDRTGGELLVKTPWGILESNAVLAPIITSTDGLKFDWENMMHQTNASFEMSFDERRLIGFKMVSKDGKRVLDVYNPVRPISLLFQFERLPDSKLRFTSEFCWNLASPFTSTIGLDAWVNRGFHGKFYQTRIHAERFGLVNLKVAHLVSSLKLDQQVGLTWNSPRFNTTGRTGYHLLLLQQSNSHFKNNEFSLEVDFPWRSVILDMQSNQTSKETLRSIGFKWDSKRDVSKFLGMKWHKEVKSAWRVSESSDFLEFSHPMSSQPLMISIDQILKDNRFQHIEIEVKFKPEPESNFGFVISRNNSDWKNFKAMIRQVETNLFASIDFKTTADNQHVVGLSYMNVNGSISNVIVDASSAPENQFLRMYFSDGDGIEYDILQMKLTIHEDPMIAKIKIFSIDSDVAVHSAVPYFETKVRDDGIAKFHLSFGLLHKKDISGQLSVFENDRLIDYFKASIQLNTSRTLSSRIKWHPKLLHHLMELDFPTVTLSELFSDISVGETLDAVSDEIDMRWNIIASSLITAVRDSEVFTTNEFLLIKGEFIRTIGFIRNFYESNTLYIKDITRNLEGLFSILSNFGNTIGTSLVSVLKTVQETCTFFCEFYGSYEWKIEKIVMDFWDRVEQFLGEVWHENLEVFSTFFENLEEAIDTFLDVVEGRIQELENKIVAVGFVRKVIQIYQDYVTWVDEIPIQDYINRVEEIFSLKVWDNLSYYLSPLIEAIQSGMEREYFKELMETPPLPYMRFVAQKISIGFSKFWDALDIEQRIKSLVQTSLKHVDNLLQRYIPSVHFITDKDGGFIEYDQSLSSLVWEDFTEFPRFQTSTEDSGDVNQITNFYYQILDKIENLKPVFDMNIRKILPPFGSYALMAGDHHYFTFDDKYYRFAGECSYILVADLSQTEDPFSIIVNYDNLGGISRKKSYTIVGDGKLVEIDVADFKVTVNGKKTELPIQVGRIYIRRHQTGLEMHDTRGFQMSCSLYPSVCTVWASGWHFGKLGGLLGTYDNEPVNDFTNPEGQIIKDVSTFAYSWRVGRNSGYCRMKNFARNDTEWTDIDNICFNLLKNRGSPLRPCFNTVDTDIFMDMCKYDVSQNLNSANRAEAACSSMSAYVAECQKKSVDVWMPPTCVRCRLEDGSALTTGENATFEVNGRKPPPQSSDNIIIVEESLCVSSDTIAESIKRLDTALNNEGLKDNRYAVVGFGGRDLHSSAHIKTMSSRVWAHSTLFKVSSDNYSLNSGKSDLYGAIEYSATLGFRAGVSKNMIAVTCENSKCGEPEKYADLLTLLVENDIKLHMLTPTTFSAKVKNNRKQEKTNEIFGIDIGGAYTEKNAKRGNVPADKSLMRQINVPKDFCTPLAMESNGTRFNIGNPSKKLLEVWSRRVAQTSHPSDCQRCECVPDRYGSASLMCHQCVSPSLWKFMEEWNSYQSEDGEELIPLENYDTEDFMMP